MIFLTWLLLMLLLDPAEGDADRATRHLHGPHGGGEEDGQGRLPQQRPDTRDVVGSAAGSAPSQPYVSRPYLVTFQQLKTFLFKRTFSL